ncbi:MAG: glucans biosynthesis glucosyltransferase MdoH [Amaricoccus sp.]|nr:glucans biosynthesis glucosyltransferase MdoH [Amaricoccus sp.]
MPVRPIDTASGESALPRPPGVLAKRLFVAAIAVGIVGILAWAMASGLARDGIQPGDALVFGLYLPNVALNGAAAATAFAGLFWARRRRRADPPADWRPEKRTAILIPSRNEDVPALGARLRALMRDLADRGLGAHVDLFLLSDSDDPRAIAAEERMAIELACGDRPRLYYRRRLGNEGRKVGNLSNWLRQWGGHYAYMLTLDADSVMSARRIAAMIRRMETRPRLGLIQSGIRLSGGESRFARLQQRAGRLYGAPFIAGLAGWSGSEGNYYGHNALIRVAAFSGAAGLPKLPGQAPFGGDILSHDFVEAAWMRRAGWAIEINPDSVGSAEGGPETVIAYHKRDRRWCQGNMQHLQLLRARGLHPVSRLHLLLGIAGYLAAPLWLALVVVAILAHQVDGMLWPTIGAMALILVQKAAGVVDRLLRRPGAWARRIVLGAAVRELALSTLLAPLIMLRQTVSVASIVSGQDCGWKPPAGAKKAGDMPWLEPAAGAALIAAVIPGLATPWHVLLIAPIALPLLAAPLITAWLDARPGTRFALPLPAISLPGGYALQR